MSTADVVVLRFGSRRVPRSLAGLPVADQVDSLPDARRLLVLGADADLATVLAGLLRADRLDVEVGHVRHAWSARRARDGTPRRVPLIRDETGAVLVRAAYWLPAEGATFEGEAVVDDTTLFSGSATAVRIEPTQAMPGLRASVLTGRMRPRRWVTGRAAQLGTVGALVVRDGVAGPREVKRSTFYRHVQGWLAVR